MWGISFGVVNCEAYALKGNNYLSSSEEAKKAVNTMYFSHPGVYENDFDLDNDGEPDYCASYWLASPAGSASTDTSCLVGVSFSGKVMYSYATHEKGIRPVICLKSDIYLQLQQNDEGDSYYKLVGNDE